MEALKEMGLIVQERKSLICADWRISQDIIIEGKTMANREALLKRPSKQI
jgi:hypothetical protein